MKNVVLPESITKIETDAFGGCVSLEELALPDSLTDLHPEAFIECNSLKRLCIRGIEIDARTVEWHKFKPNNIFLLLDNNDYSQKIPASLKGEIAARSYSKSSQPEAFVYIKRNPSRVFKRLIDIGDYTSLKSLLDTERFITKKNIDRIIDHAYEKAADDNDEILQLLTSYRNEHFARKKTKQ